MTFEHSSDPHSGPDRNSSNASFSFSGSNPTYLPAELGSDHTARTDLPPGSELARADDPGASAPFASGASDGTETPGGVRRRRRGSRGGRRRRGKRPGDGPEANAPGDGELAQDSDPDAAEAEPAATRDARADHATLPFELDSAGSGGGAHFDGDADEAHSSPGSDPESQALPGELLPDGTRRRRRRGRRGRGRNREGSAAPGEELARAPLARVARPGAPARAAEIGLDAIPGEELEPLAFDDLPAGIGQRRAPAGQRRAPAGQRRAPAGQRRAPAGQRRAPAGQRRAPAGHGHEPADHGRAPEATASGATELADGAKRRRRGSRGGRGRRGEREAAAPSRPNRSVRPPAPGRAAPVEIESIPGEEDDLFELGPAVPLDSAGPLERERETAAAGDDDTGLAGGRRRKRSRRRRGRAEPALEGAPAERGRTAAVTDEEQDEDDLESSAPEVERNALILVNASDPEEQRVAVVEHGSIVDFQMTVRTETSVVNDIYRGRVVNLEPAIGAAFVDFGQGRNGFLHTSDVLSAYGDKDWSLDKLLTTSIDPDEWDENSSLPKASDELHEAEGQVLEAGPENGSPGAEEGAADGDSEVEGEAPARAAPAPARGRSRTKEAQRPHGRDARRFRARPRLPITDLLKKGQMVVVQVTKDAIGDKGPTLTTYISIPGRYLVLMPSMSRTGVSRKIEDEKERRRLKKILQQLEVPPGMGVIVRTAGVGHSKADLKRDLDYLKGAWEAFSRRLKSGNGPAPLYQESDVSIRTVRDLFTPGTEAVIVDDPEVHRQILDFTRKLMPENEDRVRLHSGAKPLFHTYGIEPDFEKIFARRIELPSGGSVVFDQAEALVAIDVNSGRTRTDGFDFEAIALKTNIEAAPEIARQIRLRDLGGIIVVDFIDMMKNSNMRQVERTFKESLAQDRARFKVGRISQFGLLELTRQRLGPGMSRKVFHTCPRCRGTGRIRTVESRAAAILRRLGSALTLKGFTAVEVRAHPEVVRYLKDACSEYLRALEYRFEREVRLVEVAEQSEDSVLRYLRADGREVRPGGRRKR